MHWLRKHRTRILIVVIGGFIISTFVGFGLYIRSGASITDKIAEVNEEKIPYRHFKTLFTQVVNNRRDRGEQMTPEILNQVKQEVLQSLVQESVFYQESQRYGIQIGDSELAQILASYPAFQKEGKFDAQSYANALRFTFHTTPEDFEELQRRQIAINRLRAFVLQAIKVTDKELEYDFNYALSALQGEERIKFLKEWSLKMEDFREKVRQEKSAHVLNLWYQQLGSNSKVKVHNEQIERALSQ